MSTSCDQPSVSCLKNKNNSLLVGTSHAVTKLNDKINLVSNNDLPLLISGASGIGKSLAARIIHEKRLRQTGPIVISDCQYWKQSTAKKIMKDLWNEAQGGSLLLKNIDALDIEDAQNIKSYWFEESRSSSQKSNKVFSLGKVSLMASSGSLSRNSQQRWHINHSFMAWLDYHSLLVELTPLASRIEDIPILVDYFLQNNSGINKLSFSSDGWEIITNYSWPGNVKQLQRCLEKLSVLALDQKIDSKLLLHYFPAMNPHSENVLVTGINSNTDTHLVKIDLDEEAGVKKNYDLPIPFSTKLVASSNKKIHPALLRALAYIDKNFTQSFSVAELSAQAYVSPSHLSALFKKQLGHSFKQVLLRMRIDEAVRLFNLYPDRHVTQICDDVGFSDLSFFEKRFKSQVGASPGVYRDKFCKPRHLHIIE